MRFDPSEFRRLTAAFLDAGYTFRPFTDFSAEKSVMLRHDIDFSVELAEEMAEIEAEMGIAATYFFMATSNFYNPFSKANRERISRMKSLGHVISLHFDPTVYPDLDEGFAEERAQFEAAFGPIEVVSIHRPGAFLNDNNRTLGDCLHTYQDSLFKQVKYISDSGGAFKYGHPLDSEAFGAGRTIHLLLHPIWWVTAAGSPSDKLRAWKAMHVAFLRDEMAANCTSFDGRGLAIIGEPGAKPGAATGHDD